MYPKSFRSICILDDGRQGHLQQSLALAKYLGLPYRRFYVAFRFRWLKGLSYLLDQMGIRLPILYRKLPECDENTLVFGAGSATYYALKCLIDRSRNIEAVALMLPRGYRFGDYRLIFAQEHDRPVPEKNIVPIPVNFYYPDSPGIYRTDRRAIGLIIGGDSRHMQLDTGRLKIYLDQIFSLFPEYEFAVTTSPRTSKEIEKLLEKYPFGFKIIYSENPVNPIGDFFEQCETVFVTEDSTSMISAAVSTGKCSVEVLKFTMDDTGKNGRFIQNLSEKGYLHIFDGEVKNCSRKVDFSEYYTGRLL